MENQNNKGNGNNPNQNQNQKRPSPMMILLTVLITILMISACWSMFSGGGSEEEVSYSQFISELEADRIDAIEITIGSVKMLCVFAASSGRLTMLPDIPERTQ